MTNATETTETGTPYQIDAEMLGSEFSGTLSDLGRFVEILAEVTERPVDSFERAQHVGQPAGVVEPSEYDWNLAVERFAGERPDLFA